MLQKYKTKKYIVGSGSGSRNSGSSNRSSGSLSRKKHNAAIKLQNRQRTQKAKRDLSILRNSKNRKNKATKKIQSRFQGKKTRKNLSALRNQISLERQEHQEILLELIHIPKKSKKNFDDKIKSGNFRKLNLEGAKLSTKKLNGINLAYANLKKSHLNGTKFIGAKLVGADLTGAKIKNATFEKANLTNVNFTKVIDTENAKFTNSNLTNANFYDGILTYINFSGSNLTNAQFNYTNLYVPKFIGAILTNTNFSNSNLNDFTFNDIYGNKLLNVNFSSTIFENSLPFESVIFDKCNFNDGTLNFSNFTDIDFNKCTFNKTNIKRSKFEDVHFNDCHFVNANMQQSNFKGVHFTNCKIDTTIFSGSIIDNCIFDRCDLNGSIFSSFTHPNLTTITNIQFIEPEMKNTKFDSINLNNINFNNIMLDGASFSGSDLTGSTFIGSSLRGTIFYWADLNRTNFTNAIMNEHTIFTEARGIDDNTIGLEAIGNAGRAVDTHAAWANVNMKLLYDFFKENNPKLNCDTYNPTSINAFKTSIKAILYAFVENTDETPEEKTTLRNKLDTCFTGAIDQFPNFFSPANSTTDKNFAQIIYCGLHYIAYQPSLFKNIYITSVINDIISAHGALGISCPKGAIERLITYMASSAHSYNMEYSENPTPEQTEKIEEYKKLIMIVENTDELRLSEFRNEWFIDHREPVPEQQRTELATGIFAPYIAPAEAGPNRFPEGTTIDEMMEDYTNFLRTKFGLNQGLFNAEETAKLEKLIQNDPTNGINALRQGFEYDIYELGG